MSKNNFNSTKAKELAKKITELYLNTQLAKAQELFQQQNSSMQSIILDSIQDTYLNEELSALLTQVESVDRVIVDLTVVTPSENANIRTILQEIINNKFVRKIIIADDQINSNLDLIKDVLSANPNITLERNIGNSIKMANVSEASGAARIHLNNINKEESVKILRGQMSDFVRWQRLKRLLDSEYLDNIYITDLDKLKKKKLDLDDKLAAKMAEYFAKDPLGMLKNENITEDDTKEVKEFTGFDPNLIGIINDFRGFDGNNIPHNFEEIDAKTNTSFERFIKVQSKKGDFLAALNGAEPAFGGNLSIPDTHNTFSTDYNISSIARDGNCLYNAIAFSACRAGLDGINRYTDLRSMLASYMETNRDTLAADPLVQGNIADRNLDSFDALLESVADSSYWGGAFEATLIARMLGVNIFIHQENADTIDISSDNSDVTVRIYYSNSGTNAGNHYDALIDSGVTHYSKLILLTKSSDYSLNLGASSKIIMVGGDDHSLNLVGDARDNAPIIITDLVGDARDNAPIIITGGNANIFSSPQALKIGSAVTTATDNWGMNLTLSSLPPEDPESKDEGTSSAEIEMPVINLLDSSVAADYDVSLSGNDSKENYPTDLEINQE